MGVSANYSGRVLAPLQASIAMTSTFKPQPPQIHHNRSGRSLVNDMATGEQATNIRTSNRATFSCVRCANRKVKCDRQRPCTACVKHNADCVFSPHKPPSKKQKRIKVQVLAEKLDQYEALLQKHGIDRSELTNTVNEQLPTRSGQISETQPPEAQLPTPPSLVIEAAHATDTNAPLENHSHLRFVEKYVFTS
jgi:hypothetical protein